MRNLVIALTGAAALAYVMVPPAKPVAEKAPELTFQTQSGFVLQALEPSPLIETGLVVVDPDGHVRLKRGGVSMTDAALSIADPVHFCGVANSRSWELAPSLILIQFVSDGGYAEIHIPVNGRPEYVNYSPSETDAAFWNALADLARCS